MTGRYPRAWLDELYANADIVSIVSSYLPLKKDGHRYWGLCPFHHEKTPSFTVTADLNLYYCFGCKAGGNVVQFIMEMERVPFPEAVKILADRMHVPLPEMESNPERERFLNQQERLYSANREAARFFYEQLWKPEGEEVLHYFYGRGLTDGIIRRFGLGASGNGRQELMNHLLEKGYTKDELLQAGLIVERNNGVGDMFFRRAMFPIINQHGQVLGFGGRVMGDSKPKYLNTSDTPVFNKRKGVYAINLVRKQRDLKQIILVEGYMDVVALSQAGIQGVVATLGTSLTNEQARLLKRYAPEVWLAYDGDEAGQHAIERAIGIFEAEAVPCRVLHFPGGVDPDEFIRGQGVDAFLALQPLTSVEFRMHRLRLQFDMETQAGRTDYAKACADVLRNVQSPVDLENYLESLSVQTGFSKEVLRAQVGVQTQKESSADLEHNAAYSNKAEENFFGSRSEQTILALLAAGELPSNLVQEDDFSDEVLRSIFHALQAGQSPAQLMEEAEDDRTRQTVGQIFAILNDPDRQNAVQVAESCIKNVRISRLQRDIDQLKRDLRTTEEKERVVKEITALTGELNRLKKAGKMNG